MIKKFLDYLTTGYKDGHVTKKDLETALRGFEPARKEYRTAAQPPDANSQILVALSLLMADWFPVSFSVEGNMGSPELQ
jgi:hypothetical protein